MRGAYSPGGVVALTCALALLWTGAAHAEEAYVFDPVLSLTGSCAVTAEDPVPDPAEPECPSGEGAHPLFPIYQPRSVATDAYGNIYVPHSKLEGGSVKGRIDVFDSDGYFLAELPGFEGVSLDDVVVDGEGFLYAYGFSTEAVIFRLDPKPEHDPANGIFAYEEPVKVLDGNTSGMSIQNDSIAVDIAGNLYVDLRTHINMYSPASLGNALMDSTIGEGVMEESRWISIDSKGGDIYASDHVEGVGSPSVIKVIGSEAGHPLKRTISGFSSGPISAAVSETNGQVFVGDIRIRRKVYVFDESSDDQVVSESTPTIEHSLKVSYQSRIAVDNGASSPNHGYLLVPSQAKNEIPPDHVYAFEPPPPVVPSEVTSVEASEVTEAEAELEASIDPGNPEAEYRLEYVTQDAFEESGFAEAVVAGEGKIPSGSQDISVSAAARGLAPGTSYRVRAFAENECEPGGCSDEEEATFTTYYPLFLESCPNDELRAGSSAGLPDCRAYELVTPPDTGGRPPQTIGISDGDLFGTPSVTAAGSSVSFIVGGGGIPGLGGSGAFFGDGYLAERSSTGWQTQLAGPSGAQMSNPEAGGLSPDHAFAAWAMNPVGSGELFVEGGARYIRYPDGSFQLVGRGTLDEDPHARLKTITEAGGHIIFEADRQLEPQAPSAAKALYDRTIDPLTGEEITHVVSLVPGNETPATGATYEGSSTDGTAIAFKLGSIVTSPLYLRIDNSATYIAAEEPGAEFAGLSQDGRYLFYELEGHLYRFDAETQETDPIVESGDALMVNVPAEGTSAYFVSQSVLTGEEENSEGDKALAGEWNLYGWDGKDISFVATVTERDVAGENNGNTQLDGLGLWASVPTGKKPVTTGETTKDPSRTTPDGTAILFESHASLTGYDTDGKAEIYGYDATADELSCLSCNPTGSAATGDASLLSVGSSLIDGPTKTFAQIPNLRVDGKRAFFESPDPLVLGDTNKTQDVYEWEEVGVGSCKKLSGCIYLISSGHGSRPSYLYGASASGEDVFFITTDLLVGADHDATTSIYDARVGGGFAEPEEQICVNESCKPQPNAPPALSVPAPPSLEVPTPLKPCPKSRRRVKRDGKVRCVKRHHKHTHHKHTHHKRHRSGGRR